MTGRQETFLCFVVVLACNLIAGSPAAAFLASLVIGAAICLVVPLRR